MRASTKKLTTAAVCTALAVIMCVCTAYLPLSFTPLYLAAFCIFLACKRGSLPYGILCALASLGIMFAMTGLSASWFIFLFMFAPYGILTYFVHRFNYFKLKTGLVRGVTAAVYFNVTLGLTYLVATRALPVGLDIPLTDYVNALGGYYVLAIVATLVLVPLDFIFSTLSIVVLKRIPMPVERRKADYYDNEPTAENAENRETDGGGEPEAPDGRKRVDDVFGYEIYDGDESENDNGDNSAKDT